MPTTLTRRPRKSRTRPASPANPLRPLLAKFKLSQKLASDLMDVSLSTVANALKAETLPPTMTRPFTQLQRLCQALAESAESTFVGTWLESPNEMLDGFKPVDAIRSGKLDVVWQVINGMRNGSQS